MNGLETCPKCGQPSASPPAEVYCVECATEGWEADAGCRCVPAVEGEGFLTSVECPIHGRDL